MVVSFARRGLRVLSLDVSIADVAPLAMVWLQRSSLAAMSLSSERRKSRRMVELVVKGMFEL